jgi:hypothetical protein
MIFSVMKRHEYINDFLYFAVWPDDSRGKDALLYCSGVNLDRFSPLTKGRHGLASNPAIRGLQLVKHAISALALSKGAIPKFIRGNDCAGIAPTEETWFTELLLIEKASDLPPGDILNFAVRSLLEKVFTGLRLEHRRPDKLLGPRDLQKFFETLCREMKPSG